MSKKIVLFIAHGMGEPGKDWEKKAAKVLAKSREGLLGNKDFSKIYDVVPLNYHQHFTKYWEAYNSRAEALGKISIGGSTPDIVKHIVSVSQKSVDDSDMWVSHWGDVALYLGTHLGSLVRADVWDQIVRALAERSTPRFGIIAHSLGTRVLYDTLQRAYGDDADNTRRLFGKPRLIAMIANVTRLSSLNDDYLKEGMLVYPSREQDIGACYRYANIWHPLDPFARIRQFYVERYPPLAMARGVHEVEARPLDVVDSPENVHNLDHYLKIPEVAACVINCMEWRDRSDSGPVDLTAIDKYRQEYEKETLEGKWQDKVEAIEELDLLDLANLSKIKELVEK